MKKGPLRPPLIVAAARQPISSRHVDRGYVVLTLGSWATPEQRRWFKDEERRYAEETLGGVVPRFMKGPRLQWFLGRPILPELIAQGLLPLEASNEGYEATDASMYYSPSRGIIQEVKRTLIRYRRVLRRPDRSPAEKPRTQQSYEDGSGIVGALFDDNDLDLSPNHDLNSKINSYLTRPHPSSAAGVGLVNSLVRILNSSSVAHRWGWR
ncbi:hypothetical protein FA13DRAFT_1712920 [Coprinellus micaceus]|uniref:Uncharacterized protein n=1 Tax=Coprinellus micaceus TaxID=71717 RepID=A0A4Y7SYJ3_COPMI|nr:hypothetical protein FA13DRAFT_1712920 [Coprinellus micaceus]